MSNQNRFAVNYEDFKTNGVALLPRVLKAEDLAPVIEDIQSWIDICR